MEAVLGDAEPPGDFGDREFLVGDHFHGGEFELGRVNLAWASHQCISS